ncbi:MAG: response regulator transcription factor [Burkholderiaceae bacterium]|jgi:DNA-binding NarL/FixJ family response regulator|nr:response regulator transcription factor [Burkholderiales bacterium]MCZ8101348.1 response regulator transcription factor [Burkholderiales bacterium]MCZ8337614.1 response regulator transcription factor [Burkholderiaceae bacterium]
MSMRVLIVDDHPLVRGGVVGQLAEAGEPPGVEQAGCLADALRVLATTSRVDLVLLDLDLPDTVGTSGVETLRQRFPRVPVMVLSAAHDRATIDRCLRAGASGFLPKTASGERLRTAVRAVAGGGIYVPRDTDGAPTRAAWGATAAAASAGGGRASSLRDLGLTDRQSDVLRLILRGLPNKLIGRQLQLAEGTVKVHVSAVLRALNARNRTQAVLAVNRLGLKLPE